MADFSPPSPADIEELVQRAQRGEPAAVGLLYQTYAQKIYRYIVVRVADEAEAEDLTAEVFVKMVEGLPNYRLTNAPFEAWLYRIAAARVVDFYRRTRRRPQEELTETMAANDPLPEEHLQQNQEVAQLHEALQQLNEEQQTVLILRFVERRSHEEVADILGKGVNAVRSIQHRALVRLAAVLDAGRKTRSYLRGEL
jgi:RNA polymerase sigma-70 factor (ECF subfamily)